MRLFILLSCLLLIGLILCPAVSLAAASDAATLWWTRVFPALLPFLITVGVLERSGLFAWLGTRKTKRISPLALVALLFGGLCGYPIGAKLLGGCQKNGTLTPQLAQTYSYYANLGSPVFIVSVVAIGLFSNVRTALPICISIYAIALAVFLPIFVFSKRPQQANSAALTMDASCFSDAIFGGMESILRIGGCIVFAAVLNALLQAARLPWLIAQVLPVSESTVRAVLMGVLELTCGCQAASALPLHLAMRLALCTFFLQFGGLSVLLQTLGFLRLSSVPRYLLTKLCMALCSSALCYVLTPLLCPDAAAAAFAGSAAWARNGATLLGVLFSCGFSLLCCAVFTLCVRTKNRSATK